MRILELLGFAGGALFAPIAAAGSFLRQARVFHPDGVVYRAVVTVDAQDGPAKEVAARLPALQLVRLSSALWKTSGGRARRPDLLGVAIRFRHDPTVSVIPEQGDQDLPATMRSLLTFLPALFTTNAQLPLGRLLRRRPVRRGGARRGEVAADHTSYSRRRDLSRGGAGAGGPVRRRHPRIAGAGRARSPNTGRSPASASLNASTWISPRCGSRRSARAADRAARVRERAAHRAVSREPASARAAWK
ncbi:MAG: hypothetical protein R3F14_05985 [Polyangiaceae bacterium]